MASSQAFFHPPGSPPNDAAPEILATTFSHFLLAFFAFRSNFAAASSLATCTSATLPPLELLQSSPGSALQKGQTSVIGLMGSRSGILVFITHRSVPHTCSQAESVLAGSPPFHTTQTNSFDFLGAASLRFLQSADVDAAAAGVCCRRTGICHAPVCKNSLAW
jgi:hypothetical protein